MFQKVLIFSQEAITSSKRINWRPRKRCKIIVLRESGLSYSEIARQVSGSVTSSGVRKFCLRYQKTYSTESKARKGRKRTTTSIDARRIKRPCPKIEKCHQWPSKLI